ncbi:MAG: hypothetical protein ABL897_12290 [Hyphomicrobium sp.]
MTTKTYLVTLEVALTFTIPVTAEQQTEACVKGEWDWRDQLMRLRNGGYDIQHSAIHLTTAREITS